MFCVVSGLSVEWYSRRLLLAHFYVCLHLVSLLSYCAAATYFNSNSYEFISFPTLWMHWNNHACTRPFPWFFFSSDRFFPSIYISVPHDCHSLLSVFWIFYLLRNGLLGGILKTRNTSWSGNQLEFWDMLTNIVLEWLIEVQFYLSRNNQQMSRHSTLFPVISLHVSDTFCVHHQEINKINCICNLVR
jgi:hypothetical protein